LTKVYIDLQHDNTSWMLKLASALNLKFYSGFGELFIYLFIYYLFIYFTTHELH